MSSCGLDGQVGAFFGAVVQLQVFGGAAQSPRAALRIDFHAATSASTSDSGSTTSARKLAGIKNGSGGGFGLLASFATYPSSGFGVAGDCGCTAGEAPQASWNETVSKHGRAKTRMVKAYHAPGVVEMGSGAKKCAMRERVSPLIAFILGLVEGLTEYLPVSSTGHLLLTSRLLGLDAGPVDSFDIVIQFGAILAVVVHYRTLLLGRLTSLLKGEAGGRNLLLALVIGFVPTAVCGLAFRKAIKRVLFGPTPILVALVVGGVIILVDAAVRARASSAPRTETTSLANLSLKQAALVGFGQCFSLVPGASRSLCTILAGRMAGLSMSLAAEFSFLLGLPTLGAACLYEGYKERAALLTLGALPILVGLVTSFFVAWAVIAVFIRYLQQRTLVPFGIYRIVLGVVGLMYLVRHV